MTQTFDVSKFDIRTPREKERDQRNERICNKYIGLRTAYPDVKLNRICTMIGESERLACSSIRKILKEKHLIG